MLLKRARSLLATAVSGGMLVALLLLCPGEGSGAGTSGMLEVKKIEVGFYPGEDALIVQAHLINAQVVEYQTDNPRDVEMVLQITRTYSESRVRLFVELSSNEVKGFWLVSSGGG